MPTRVGSTSARVWRYFPAAMTSLVLRVAATADVRGGAERLPVADARAVVHRHHDVALARKPLVHRVRLVIEVHVVVAEQHLPDRATVDEDDRRSLLTRLEILRQEELVVELDAVVGLERDVLRRDLRGARGIPSCSTGKRYFFAPTVELGAIATCIGRVGPDDNTATCLPDASARRIHLDVRAGRDLRRRDRPPSRPSRCGGGRCRRRWSRSRASCRRARAPSDSTAPLPGVSSIGVVVPPFALTEYQRIHSSGSCWKMRLSPANSDPLNIRECPVVQLVVPDFFAPLPVATSATMSDNRVAAAERRTIKPSAGAPA